MGKSSKTDNNTEAKERILDAAEKVFAEMGYDGARVDKIAKEAGVPKSLIYYHYLGKEALLDALMERLFSKGLSHITDELMDIDLLDPGSRSQHTAFDKLLDFLEKHRRIFSILLSESFKNTERNTLLFQFSDFIAREEVKKIVENSKAKGMNFAEEKIQFIITDFFTGLLPTLCFVQYSDVLAGMYNIDKHELKQRFYKAMEMTHYHYHQMIEEE